MTTLARAAQPSVFLCSRSACERLPSRCLMRHEGPLRSGGGIRGQGARIRRRTMAGSMKKGALPPDPRVVIPKIEDYLDVSSLISGLPAAPGIIDRESKVKAWPMYANGPDPAAPPVIASTGVGDCTCAGIAHFLA